MADFVVFYLLTGGCKSFFLAWFLSGIFGLLPIISVVVNPIFSPCRINLVFIPTDDSYVAVVFCLLPGRCNPLFAVIIIQFSVLIVLFPFGYLLWLSNLIPSGSSPSFSIIAPRKPFYPQWVLFHSPFAGNVCGFPFDWSSLHTWSWYPDAFLLRSIYPLTTYNPVMDDLPCEGIIYVWTAIDNTSHALFGRSLSCFPSRVSFVALV
jgi:hypothetical protein